MRRDITAFLTAALFAATLLLTSWHKAHCDDEHDEHDAAQCPVCQLAAMPGAMPISSIEPVAPIVFVEPATIPFASIIPAAIKGLPQARAPPERIA